MNSTVELEPDDNRAVPAQVRTTGRQWASVLTIAAGTFLLVTTEFMPIGLLGQIANGLVVSDGVAGLAVTVPGVVAAIAAPLLTMGAAASTGAT
jgi:predicted MFS family arabinose efflux permease